MWPLLITSALAIAPQAVPNPRLDNQWVMDLAEVFQDEQRLEMERVLSEIEASTTAEVAVVTVQDTELTPKQFTTELFNHWGVGKADANNGLLVVLVIDQRRLEMETGYGLEPVLPDGWLGTMQRTHMVPEFKKGDYGAGVLAGLAQVRERMEAQALEVRVGNRALPPAPWPDRGQDVAAWAEDPWTTRWAGWGGATGILVLSGALLWRRRRRLCDACDVYMPPLSEAEEDAHLTAVQQAEEAHGSRQWTVHACPTCDEVKSFSRTNFLAFYSSCPHCSARLVTTTRTTLSSPTYTSSGRARVTSDCGHCSYRTSKTVILPKLERPKSTSSSSGGYSSGSSSWSSGSSSSSSSSSFGGGRSGGGGAGSSW